MVYVLNGGVLLLVSYWGERGYMKNTHCDFLEMWSAVLKDSMVSVKRNLVLKGETLETRLHIKRYFAKNSAKQLSKC